MDKCNVTVLFYNMPFKFKVGQEVRCTYPKREFSGVVIARTRYTKAAEKFCYTAGDAVYLIEMGTGKQNFSAVEQFLEAC